MKRWVLVEKSTPNDEILILYLQKLVDTCGYELPTNLQKNFMQKDLTKVKIFQKNLGGATFFETPCRLVLIDTALHGGKCNGMMPEPLPL